MSGILIYVAAAFGYFTSILSMATCSIFFFFFLLNIQSKICLLDELCFTVFVNTCIDTMVSCWVNKSVACICWPFV